MDICRMTTASTNERVEVLEQDLELAQRLNRKLQAELRSKDRKLAEIIDGSPMTKEARSIFEQWVGRCWGGKGRKPAFDPKRQALVAQALKHHPPEDLRRAIDGLALKPHAGSRGRSATPYQGSKPYADLEHAIGDAKRIEACIGYLHEVAAEATRLRDQAAEQMIERNGRNLDDPDRPMLYPDSFRCFVAALDRCGIEVPGSPPPSGEYMVRCPAHEDRSPSFRWREAGDGRILHHCHAGCEPEAVMRALGLEWTEIGPAFDPATGKAGR
jgi:hypothetical protein